MYILCSFDVMWFIYILFLSERFRLFGLLWIRILLRAGTIVALTRHYLRSLGFKKIHYICLFLSLSLARSYTMFPYSSSVHSLRVLMVHLDKSQNNITVTIILNIFILYYDQHIWKKSYLAAGPQSSNSLECFSNDKFSSCDLFIFKKSPEPRLLYIITRFTARRWGWHLDWIGYVLRVTIPWISMEK